MTEVSEELTSSLQERPILESLGIPEKESGKKPIGTLIMCGQGPVQDSATKIKLESLDSAMSGYVSGHEANTWMRLIARAAGELDREGDVGLIITTGKDTGGSYTKGNQQFAPTEAELMRKIIENVYGQKAQIELEQEAKNTLFNVINAANIIDSKKESNPNDPNLENVWLIGSHFHGPRIKILASLFGFDPNHVLSAEEVLITASQIKQQQRGDKKLPGFDRQKALQDLISVRLTGEPINEEGQNYFQRKTGRARSLLDRVVEDYLKKQGIPESEMETKRREIEEKLFIEEQKDAQARMRAERRWVRGLAMEADYVLPYSVYLKNDDRLLGFLLKFDSQTLEKYGIRKEELEAITPENKMEAMKGVRTRIDPNRWSWEVVKQEWENEEYPPEVKTRFVSLGIPEEDIECLSRAEVPPLKSSNPKEDDQSPKVETEKQATTVWCIRHCPTDWSREHKIQGNVDTEILWAETNSYFENLGVRNIPVSDVVVVSGLKRTQQTFEALKKHLGWSDVKVVVEPAFNERKWGILEGRTHEEVRAILLQNKEIVKEFPYIRSEQGFEGIWNDPNFKAEGGESLTELGERVKTGLSKLQELYPGKNVLAITHAGVLQTQGLPLDGVSAVSVERGPGGDIIIRRN